MSDRAAEVSKAIAALRRHARWQAGGTSNREPSAYRLRQWAKLIRRLGAKS